MTYYGIAQPRHVFSPNRDEVIEKGDELIGLAVGGALDAAGLDFERPLRSWYEQTTDERFAKWKAFRDEPVQVRDVTLLRGEWYDVTVSNGYRSTRPQTWRNCRYLGKLEGSFRPTLYFERWGANAATDPYARKRQDHAPLADPASAPEGDRIRVPAGVIGAKPLDVPDSLRAKADVGRMPEE